MEPVSVVTTRTIATEYTNGARVEEKLESVWANGRADMRVSVRTWGLPAEEVEEIRAEVMETLNAVGREPRAAVVD